MGSFKVKRRRRGRPTGHRLSEASKHKIAMSKTGYEHTDETKSKISQTLKQYFANKKESSMKYHKWTEQEIGKIIYILITYIGNGVTMKSLAIELGRHFKTSEKAVLAQFQLYSCPVYVGDGTGQARHALSWDVVSQLKRMKPKGISDILQMQVFPKSSAVVAASKADKDVSYTTVDRQTHPDNMVERFILKELDHNGQQVRRLVRNGSTSDNSLKALILEMYRERRGHLHTIKLFVETEIEVELEHKITVNILH